MLKFIYLKELILFIYNLWQFLRLYMYLIILGLAKNSTIIISLFFSQGSLYNTSSKNKSFYSFQTAGVLGNFAVTILSLMYFIQVFVSDSSSVTYWFVSLISPTAVALAMDKVSLEVLRDRNLSREIDLIPYIILKPIDNNNDLFNFPITKCFT